MGFNELTVWVYKINCEKDINSLCKLGLPNLPSKEWTEEEKLQHIFKIIISRKNSETYRKITENRKLDPKKSEDREKIIDNIKKELARLILEQNMYHWHIENKDDIVCGEDYVEVRFTADVLKYAEFRSNIFIYPVQIGPITFRIYKKDNLIYLFAFSKKDHIHTIRDFLQSILACKLDNVGINSQKLLSIEKKYADVVLEASWDEVEYTYKAKIGKGNVINSQYREEFDKHYTRISSRFSPNDNIINISQILRSSKIGIYARSTARTLKVSATYKNNVRLRELRDSISTFILNELL